MRLPSLKVKHILLQAKRFFSFGLTVELFLFISCIIFSDASSTSLTVGWSVYFFGLALFLWISLYTQNPTQLSALFGPWKSVRYPLLLAQTTCALAPLIACRHAFLFAVSLPLMAVILRRRFDRVEKRTALLFDVQFLKYAAEVPAIFPSLRSLAEPPTGKGATHMSFRNMKERFSSKEFVSLTMSFLALATVYILFLWRRGGFILF